MFQFARFFLFFLHFFRHLHTHTSHILRIDTALMFTNGKLYEKKKIINPLADFSFSAFRVCGTFLLFHEGHYHEIRSHIVYLYINERKKYGKVSTLWRWFLFSSFGCMCNFRWIRWSVSVKCERTCDFSKINMIIISKKKSCSISHSHFQVLLCSMVKIVNLFISEMRNVSHTNGSLFSKS